jgi:hypothetical protein
MAKPLSNEIQADALKMAHVHQKPGQPKAQTKLVAQGIEKGIAEYKKLQKAKARGRDKERKKDLAASAKLAAQETPVADEPSANPPGTWVPWLLLALSWLGFAIYEGLNWLGG